MSSTKNTSGRQNFAFFKQFFRFPYWINLKEHVFHALRSVCAGGNNEGDLVFWRSYENHSYFDAVSNIVKQSIVDWLPNVAHGPLHVAGGDDLVGARGVLICGQDADFSTRHFLLMNIHSLHQEGRKTDMSCRVKCIYFRQGINKAVPCLSLQKA